MLKEGTVAATLEGYDQHGNMFRLAEERGRWVVLYFYPKDETLGCTAEACAFRDAMESLETSRAEVVGVSTQSQESHRTFSEHHRLGFRLIADPDKRIAKAYDALGFLGLAQRVTYLIDPEGQIRDAYRSEMSPTSHVDHVRSRLREFQGPAA